MLGTRNVSDNAMAADAYILDVACETVGQWQEQQQTIRLVQHLVEDDVTVLHDMGEVTVGQHGAFRLTRGSGSVYDGGHIVSLDAGDGPIKFGIRDIGTELDHSVQAVFLEVEHIAQTVHRITNLLHRQRMGIVTGESD